MKLKVAAASLFFAPAIASGAYVSNVADVPIAKCRLQRVIGINTFDMIEREAIIAKQSNRVLAQITDLLRKAKTP